jgi:hypothetical protein
MLTRTTTLQDAIAIHEAAFAVRACSVGLRLRPPDLKGRLRRYFADVVDFDTDDGFPTPATR